MNKNQIGLVVATVFTCLANPAFAAYLGVGMGDTAADIANSSGQVINSSSTSFRLLAGSQISQYLSVEAEYIDLGKFTNDTASIAAKGLGISGVIAAPMADSFSIFGKIGLARIESTATANQGSVLTGLASDTRIGLTLGYGVQIEMAPNAIVRISWDRYKCSALVGPFADRVDVKSAAALIFKF